MWWEKDKKNQTDSAKPDLFEPTKPDPSPRIPIEPAEPRPMAPVTPQPERLENLMPETTLKPSPVGAPGQHQTFLGGSVVLRGELSGDEDLTIEGQFDGAINLQGHCLTVGQHGQVKADITARQVSVSGKLNGKVNALEKISIQRTGNVVGDLISAGVAIEEGAYFKGSIEILRDGEKPASPPPVSRTATPVGAASKA